MSCRVAMLVCFLVGLSWPGEAAARAVVAGYVARDQPISATWVAETIGKELQNDPDRCEAIGFGQWSRVPYATGYDVLFNPPPDAPGSQPVGEFVTDDAPYHADGTRQTTRNPRPPNSLMTPLGLIKWSSNLARVVTNRYSTGDGCDNARARLRPFIPAPAVAHLSIPVRRIVRDKPPPRRRAEFLDDPPKGAVMRVVEVDGVLMRRRGRRTERVRYGDWLKPGDIVTVSTGGAAAIEMIIGGRIAFVGDRAIMILNESQVKDLTQDPQWKRPLQKTVAVWRKISVPKQSLEVETAGGIIGIKG